MSRFYCRDDELRKLNKRYENGKFECVVIYGRRRVGKTALINEFCTVSYTHLDVYKRQGLLCAREGFRLCTMMLIEEIVESLCVQTPIIIQNVCVLLGDH